MGYSTGNEYYVYRSHGICVSILHIHCAAVVRIHVSISFATRYKHYIAILLNILLTRAKRANNLLVTINYHFNLTPVHSHAIFY